MWSFTHKAFEIVAATLPAILDHDMDCAQAKAVINRLEKRTVKKKDQDENIEGADIS